MDTTFHLCSTCGLKLPIGISNCPNDGTYLANSDVERLAETYEFLEEIGSGSIGIVYKARHRILNHTVAIKTLRAGSMDAASQKRFEQEAKLVSSLNHPGIVRLRDFGSTESGQLHMVLDFVGGQSLDQSLSWQGALSVEDSLEIITQVCDAMEYAHQKDIVHRDIKPSNIMFFRSENSLQVKVLDFGIAKALDLSSLNSAALTKTGEIFGSPLYMSPEQASGKKLDARSDIYSLGIVMYEILSGASPFAGKTAFDIINSQIAQEVPPLSSTVKPISPHLDAVVAKALAKKPEDRFQSMSEFRQALFDLKAGKKSPWLGKIDDEKIRKHKTEKFERKVIIVSIALTLVSLGLVTLLSLQKEKGNNNPADSPKSDPNLSLGFEPTTANKAAKRIIEKHKDDKNIDLSHLPITDEGLEPFQQCTQTEEIKLRETKLRGPGLAYLIHLPLRKLDLYSSAVNDRALSEITNMKFLRELNLSHTDIDSSALKYLSGLPELRRLSLKDIPVDDRGVDELAKIKNLQCLNLKYNGSITAKGMEKLAAMPNLRDLRVRRSPLGDDQFVGLKASKNLRILDIREDKNVTDKTIAALLKTNIEQLNVVDTGITDRGVAMLVDMPSLRALGIGGMNVSREAVATLRQKRADVKFTHQIGEDNDHF
ncbi:hypothetical protein BH10CYA1_BH10CYA1_46440 [soil metagenome]